MTDARTTMDSRWYTLGVVWCFGSSRSFVRGLLELSCSLAGIPASDIQLTVFDGRYEHKIGPGRTDIDRSLPEQFCSITATNDQRPRELKPHEVRTPRLDVAINISPSSSLWGRAEVMPDATCQERSLSMVAEAVERANRESRNLDRPQTCRFQAINSAGAFTPGCLDAISGHALQFLDSLEAGTVAGGGIDVIQDFAEIADSRFPLARASDYPKLRHAFDDMHHVMFGLSAAFAGVGEADAAEAFVTVTRRFVQGDSYAIAITRTARPGSRKFAKVLPALLIGQ